MDLTAARKGGSLGALMFSRGTYKSRRAAPLRIRGAVSWEAVLLWSGLGLLFLASQLGGLHNLLSPHTYCAVHEQMEHGADPSRADSGSSGHAAHGDERELAGESVSQLPEEDHDNCDLVLLAKRCKLLAPSRMLLALPGDHSLPGIGLRFARLHHGPRLYRLAPKNSPPRPLAV